MKSKRITSFGFSLKVTMLLIFLPLFLGMTLCEETALITPSQEELFDTVASALNDQDPEIRAAAAEVIWKFGDISVPNLLIKCLDDKNFEARLNALNSLGSLGDKTVVPQVGQFLQRRAISGSEVLNAVCALGAIRAEGGVQYLEPIKDYPDIHLRRCVADSLAQIGGQQAVDVLKLMLGDSDKSVGIWAAGNLALLGVEEGEQYLRKYTGGGAYKRQVDEILSMIKAGSEDELPNQGLSYALQVYQQDQQKGSWANLEKQIADPDNEYRKDMILVYASIKGKEAREKLRELLEDKRDEIRVYAAGALLGIGDTAGLPVLKSALEGKIQIENPSWTIAYLLEFTQTSLKKPLLLQMYKGEDVVAKINAASQLCDLSADHSKLQKKKGGP